MYQSPLELQAGCDKVGFESGAVIGRGSKRGGGGYIWLGVPQSVTVPYLEVLPRALQRCLCLSGLLQKLLMSLISSSLL